MDALLALQAFERIMSKKNAPGDVFVVQTYLQRQNEKEREADRADFLERMEMAARRDDEIRRST